MLLLKDINQRDLTKAELLEDRVNDIIKYFYSTNQFREGKILEILQHGVLIVKNKHNIINTFLISFSLLPFLQASLLVSL